MNFPKVTHRKLDTQICPNSYYVSSHFIQFCKIFKLKNENYFIQKFFEC